MMASDEERVGRWVRWRSVFWAAWIALCVLLVAMGDARAWEHRTLGLSAAVYSVATHGERWLAGGDGRAYWSRDAGGSWRPLVLEGAGRGARGPATSSSLGAGARAPEEEARGLGAGARRSVRSPGEGLREETRARRARDDASRRSASDAKRGARSSTFLHAAMTDDLACVASASALFCGQIGRAPTLRRIGLPPSAPVRALVAVWAEGALLGGAIAVAAGMELYLLRGSGTLQPVTLPQQPLDLAPLEGGAVWVRTPKALLRVDLVTRRVTRTLELPRSIARVAHRGAAMARGLAVRGADVYLGFPRSLWRRDGVEFQQIRAPAEPLRALRSCGPRLIAHTGDGLHELGVFGWRPVAVGLRVRQSGCVKGRLLLAGEDGLWLEDEGALPAHHDVSLSAWTPPRPPRFARRARLAAWAPEVALDARLVFGRDARASIAELRWPSLDSVTTRWHHDPVLRLRGSSRIEAWLTVSWPFGRGGDQQVLQAARRAERQLARRWRVAQQRALALHRRLRKTRRGRATDVRTALRRHLRFAEARALVRALSLRSAS